MNTVNFWREMYEEALSELELAKNRFNNADPNDKEAIDSIIFSMNSAEKMVASTLRQLKQVKEELKCPA